MARIFQKSRGRLFDESWQLPKETSNMFEFFCAAAALITQARDLEVYWIDVECGAATLIVTPSGNRWLIDTGNPGERDATSESTSHAAGRVRRCDFS